MFSETIYYSKLHSTRPPELRLHIFLFTGHASKPDVLSFRLLSMLLIFPINFWLPFFSQFRWNRTEKSLKSPYHLDQSFITCFTYRFYFVYIIFSIIFKNNSELTTHIALRQHTVLNNFSVHKPMENLSIDKVFISKPKLGLISTKPG